MDRSEFFGASRVLIVAGKGGVGKTTVTAVTARAAAECGLRVLVVDLDDRPGLRALVTGEERALTYADEMLVDGLGPDGRGRISGRSIQPGAALADYLSSHGLGRLTGRLASTGVLELVSSAAPGIDDLLVLGKIKQIALVEDYDLIVVDGPPAGHAISFLLAPSALADAVRLGPIRSQSDEVLAMLADPSRCQVQLVAIPETTPVTELIETAYMLEERIGVALAPVVVNATDTGTPLQVPTARAWRHAPNDPLRAAAEFRNQRRARHAAETARLRTELPLPQLVLPWLAVAAITAADVLQLAEVYGQAIDQVQP